MLPRDSPNCVTCDRRSGRPECWRSRRSMSRRTVTTGTGTWSRKQALAGSFGARPRKAEGGGSRDRRALLAFLEFARHLRAIERDASEVDLVDPPGVPDVFERVG